MHPVVLDNKMMNKQIAIKQLYEVFFIGYLFIPEFI